MLLFDQGNLRVNFNRADYSNLRFSNEDKEILRDLGKQLVEIVSSNRMAENTKLWLQHNKLQTTQPVILCDPENGWNEIVTEKQIKCKNSIAQHWECHLRKQLFSANEIKDNYVVEAHFNLSHIYNETQWRVSSNKNAGTTRATNLDNGAYHIECILEDYSKIHEITKPKLSIDFETTNKVLEIAHEVFDGILEVRLNSVWYWSIGLTDELVFLRGMENLMFDFIDEPDKVHEVLEILCNGVNEKLDYLEANNLFSLNNDSSYVGSGGIGFTDELPSSSFDGKVTTKDMWGLLESQVTVGVSPSMFEEFIWPYQQKLMNRYGLISYGCCEPMDKRFDIVKSAPNLRRVSVSPWANRSILAEKLGQNYIYSFKPSPSPLALSTLDEDIVRKELKDALIITKANNNIVEIIMKDNHTLGSNPRNLTRWAEIAREEIESIYNR